MFSNRSVRVHPSAPPIEYGGTPGRLDRVRRRHELGPRLRRVHARVLEGVGVVPDGGLVARLEDEPVDLLVERAQSDPRRREVRREDALRVGHGLERALVDELLHETRLGDVGHVGRVTAGDRRRHHRRQVVADRLVVDLDVRVLLVEGGDHLPERRGLGARPDTVERDAPGHRLRMPRRARSASRDREHGKRDDCRHQGGSLRPATSHVVAPFWSACS